MELTVLLIATNSLILSCVCFSLVRNQLTRSKCEEIAQEVVDRSKDANDDFVRNQKRHDS